MISVMQIIILKTNCKKAILLITICLCFYLTSSCKTQPKEKAISSEAKKKSHDSWTQIIKEGWLDDNTFQAYRKSLYFESMEEHLMEARERLAWLLLLDNYEVTQEDKHIAKRLAKSRLLADLGKEKVFHKIENGKIYILLQRRGQNIKTKWKHSLMKIEGKISRLRSLRKGP